MTTRFNSAQRLRRETGSTIVYVALIMAVVLGISALAIDVGYARVARNQLQNAADASALAAARKLGSIYQPMSYLEQQAYVCDPNDIIPVAQATALSNMAATQSVIVRPEDVVIGTWVPTRNPPFEPSTPCNQPDAVQVTAHRDDELGVGGPVETFFARILGRQSMPVAATAIAALTGQSTSVPGELQLPVGVSESKFPGGTNAWCGQVIEFSPTTDPDACAGWTAFEDGANDNNIRGILLGGLGNPLPIQAGETLFNFLNGDLSEGTFEALLVQYQSHGDDVTAIYDPNTEVEPGIASEASKVPLCMSSSNTIVDCRAAEAVGPQLRYPPCQGASGCTGELRYAHEWETTIVVYKDPNPADPNCTPGRGESIAGFAQVVVYNVGMPSNKIVAARIRCDFVDPDATRSGGGNYGKKGSIPGLVR